MKKVIVLSLVALIGNIARVQAQNHFGPRTRQGQRSGAITDRERAVIAQQNQDVRIATRVAKADGVITPAEQRLINEQKRQANRTIYAAKHNHRRR